VQAFTGSPEEWDALIASLPNPHLLQTWEWSRVKAAYRWQAIPYVWWDPSSEVSSSQRRIVASAMILKKIIHISGFSARLCILYCPKGPQMDWGIPSIRGRVLDDLMRFTRQQSGIFLKLDPDIVLGRGIPGSPEAVEETDGHEVLAELTRLGRKLSADQVQFRNTVLIDLSLSEEDMLLRMKQKTRYNIKLAAKKGVTIRVGSIDDLPMLYRMYAETSIRDGFVIRNEQYYRTVWITFMHAGQSDVFPSAEPLIAEVDGEPVAAIFVFYFAGRAYYLHGMSREMHREKMPNYLLQWEAMKRAKSGGCHTYDLWGAPDNFDESDSLWSVFRFKEGLGGQVVRTAGEWDYAPNSFLYDLYTKIMPRILNVMRSRGNRSTKLQIDA
jgi:lipid II:glycine glycyltransferase (peptidoglycan interpeptide bridge formation enzyme)